MSGVYMRLLAECGITQGLLLPASFASILRYPWEFIFQQFQKFLSRELVHISTGRCGNNPSLAPVTEMCFDRRCQVVDKCYAKYHGFIQLYPRIITFQI
jgi:hypothetical protein